MKLRNVLFTLCATSFVVVLALDAAAHSEKEATTPADGASLSGTPEMIHMVFDDPMRIAHRTPPSAGCAKGTGDVRGSGRHTPVGFRPCHRIRHAVAEHRSQASRKKGEAKGSSRMRAKSFGPVFAVANVP